ncbi:ABC transporter permease [Arsenicicoccus piscis]|uniref:ABC transporter permease n=1 Tax=Arsenicicoccus piscis TaxID=673954 RepID=A0ABQ6HTH0_9MICO|nr:ABC transporter permease [Arsenicicoccus piscis]MCH8626773.1 ABC transporter permease [Arsenicicoccus piscis]MCH8627317.1 ABC transporter permease [Arsenicicoccus piscis]GMA21457.1 hypothetical protein GCM10025862_34780 [Arsenicicoccus piscis]
MSTSALTHDPAATNAANAANAANATGPADPTTRSTGGSAGTGSPGIPFGRLLHLELRKLVDTRSGRWLLIITLGLVAAINVGFLIWGDHSTTGLTTFVGGSSQAMMLLLPVLGILAATSEFSQRTGLVTFTQEPRRLRVVLAKTLAALTLGLASMAVALLVGVVSTGIAVAIHDPVDPWHIGWGALGGVLAQLLNLLQGVAFGLLLTAPAAAIAAFYIVPTLWMFLTGMISALRDAGPWIDMARSTEPLVMGTMNGEAWAHLASAAAIWTLLPFVVGCVLISRREIK